MKQEGKCFGNRCYDDIIDLPHPVSRHHPQMPLSDRAAQFSPFAALTGHEEAIRETARLTEQCAELSEDRKEQLDEQFKELKERQSMQPEIAVTYFRPDARKAGGTYVQICGRVKKVDESGRQIVLTDGTVLAMEQVYAVEERG